MVAELRELLGSRLLQLAVTTLLVAAVIIAIADPFDFDDRPYVERLTRMVASNVQEDVAADIEARILAQTQLAELSRLANTSSRDWDLAAKVFLASHPGYVGLQLLDKTHHTQRAAVLSKDIAIATSIDFVAGTRFRGLVEAAAASSDRVAMDVIKLPTGERTFLVVVPDFANGEIAGFLVGICDLKKTLDSILSEFTGLGYSVAVLEDEDSDQIYQIEGSSSENKGDWSQVAKVRLTALHWHVAAWPKRETLAEARSKAPELAATIALLLILILVSTIRFARVLHLKSEHLRAAHNELEQRVQERTLALKQTNENLRMLSAHVLHLQDEERRRIARELHDSTAQMLSALKMNITTLQTAANDGSHFCDLLQKTGELAEQALSEVRTISYLLHPPILEDFGLESALCWYAAGFGERSGIQVDVDMHPDLGRFSPDLELMLFRVAQEALGNIHRHSGSPKAEISLKRTSVGIILQVSDQGRGLPDEVLNPPPGASPRVGVGIAGMRERVRQFGGELNITSNCHGTTLQVVLPIEARSIAATAASR